MELYNVLAEAPVRGNQVKELYIFAENEKELKELLSSAFKDKLKYSEELDGPVDIISTQSWHVN